MPAATQEPAPSGLDAKARRQFSALSTSRLPRGLGEFAARVAGSVSELTRVATLARLTRKQRARGTGEHDTVIAWLSEARQMPPENWRDFRQPTDIPASSKPGTGSPPCGTPSATSTPHDSQPPTGQELDAILARTRYLLLDFDGPVRDIFAGLPATTVAERLRKLSSPART